jgi:hypothetical protein
MMVRWPVQTAAMRKPDPDKADFAAPSLVKKENSHVRLAQAHSLSFCPAHAGIRFQRGFGAI